MFYFCLIFVYALQIHDITTASASEESCWWTGCQLNTWAVAGCSQYNLTQQNIKACIDGSEYYCCPIKKKSTVEDCWWTGCQLNDWEVEGCDSYNRTEKDKTTCDGGFKYKCCNNPIDEKGDSNLGISDENCWWSGCQPKDSKNRGCPSNTIQKRSDSCPDGDLFQCCLNNTHLNSETTKDVNEEDIETISGTSFTDYVKYLLLKSNNFSIIPDKLRCDLIDVNKSHMVRIKNEGIRVCDLCPNFPQQRYQNVYLSIDPSEVRNNFEFPDCFGLCFETNKCMALSYDHVSKKCFLFSSTDGNLEEENQWTTVFMTQPTGVLFDWMYSRHTLALGSNYLSKTQESSFLLCMNKCSMQLGCNIVSYSLLNSSCTTYQDIKNDLDRVSLEYGYISAYRMEILPMGHNEKWRFFETGDESILSLKPSKTNNDSCSIKNETHNSFYFKPCLTTPLKGCNAQTGCKTCYYPERTNGKENLSICPDSNLYYLENVEQLIDGEINNCLKNSNCMGLGLESEQVKMITTSNFGEHQYRKSFMLKFPKYNTMGVHKYLKNYEFIENLSINPISNTTNTIQILHEVTLEECISNYEKSNYKRMSFFKTEKKCTMSSESVQFIETKNVITLFKKPTFLSATLNYVRTPGIRLDPKSAVEKVNCKTNCEEMCAMICNQPSKHWCSYVSIDYFVDFSMCYFFDTDKSDLKLDPSINSIIVITQSKLNFTLSALDQVDLYEKDESMVLGCFSSTKEQTQTSLTVYENLSSTSVAIRRKRGFFDWIGKAVKSVANAVVDAVKTTVEGVVDTAKGVVKAVDKVVKGDLDGAKNAITNIPIVKDVKNAVEFGGAVITGDWDTAKKKGIDLLDSSLLDVGLTVIAPGVGKVIGTGLKSIAKGSKTAIKTLKNQSKNSKNKIKPKNNNVEKEKNNNKKRPEDKNKDKNDDIDRCERRQTRATSKKNGKYGCKRSVCDAPKGVRFSYTRSFDKCNNKQIGSRCHYECKVGYEEKGPIAMCKKKTNQMSVWDPQPECTVYKCSDSNYPVISVKTPKIDTLTSISSSKYIVAYVVMFDKSRKLPVWSVALHQSSQFQSKSYNDAKNFGRKSFFRYPCTALLNHQAVGADYSKSGWDQGHLTPANIARWSEKASKSTFSFINIAPQEPYVNEHPWQRLEFHVECFSTKRRTLVVTGICKDSLGKKIGKNNIDVPKCFWKMLCYKDENSIEQVVGFIADNSPIKPGKLAERENDIFTARSQSEIENLYDSLTGNPWLKSIDVSAGREIGINPEFNNDANSGTIWLPVNVYDCMKAKAIDKYEKDEWEKKLKSKKRKSKRDTSSKFSRGCTPSELEEKEELFYLAKQRLAAEGEIDDDSDSDEVPNGNNEVSVQNCGKRIVGYYTSWGAKKIKSNIMAKLTHIIYAFLEMRGDGTVDIGSPDVAHSTNLEEETNKSRNRLEHLMNLAKFYPHVKIMFAVGGWENSQYFSKIAASSDSRVTFIASVIKLIEKYGFDGVDIDWEYPVTGGAVEGVPQDKTNYVLLMKDLRNALDVFASDAGRKSKFLISFAGAAGQWTLDPGFDLPELLKYADFVNVMTYDFFGAWSSKWGAYTGPPAPLYFGMPPRFSGKTNVDWTIKYYTCKSLAPHKINMGIPFYGRFWNNVGDSVDGKDQMWRTANSVNGVFQGGYTPWFKIQNDHLSDQQFEQRFHEKSKSPYAWNPDTKVFLGYENKKSLEFKIKYASDKNVGGLMVWSVDLDDDDLTLLKTAYNAPLCDKTNPNEINHKCSPIDEKRWWTSEDGDDMAGLCGRSAPLYKGYYPVCDPDDPGYSCCGSSGYCGSGEKYCDCPTCKDYGNNPQMILDKPTKPTVPVTWYLLNAKEGLRGRCGRKIPKISNVFPTCNPDDNNAYCCSNGNYCGKGPDFCDCQSCVNFKKTPLYRFGPKKWWTLEDGDKKAGTCGIKAEKVDGIYEAECEPNTKFSCCSPNGFCGSGPDYCDCKGCKRF